MYLWLLVVCVFGGVQSQYGPDPDGTPADFKCGWRQLIANYSKVLRPDAEALVFDALQLDQYCNNTIRPNEASLPSWFPRKFDSSKTNDLQVFVDANKGNDKNSGSESQPLKTIQAAVDKVAGSTGATIFLRSGTFYLTAPVNIGSKSTKLTIQNFNGEEAWVSGGVELTNLKWSEYNVAGNMNIWKTSLAGFSLGGAIEGLRVDGIRVSPARYPNANPETSRWPTGYLTSNKNDWLAPKISPKPNPAKLVEVRTPNRTFDSQFQFYGGGIGGTCSIYDPPFSFWCQSKFSDGCGGCFTWNIPSGLDFQKSVPFPLEYWQNGIMMAWRQAHWANWAFEIDGYFPHNSTFLFGKGGFQGARGGPGSDWYIMNMLDLMDNATEYYYDPINQTLYYFANNTEHQPPSASTQFVAVVQHTLFNVTGESMTNPVKDLTIKGVGFRDSAWTMLQPHGVPSGGDWALERMGSCFFEYTENLVIDSIKQTRIGGNGIMLSKYNLNATIQRSEFEWMGGSAIALWGYTDEISDGGIHGVDGTDGNFPRYTLVQLNLFHEIGVWEKQSSAVFSGKAAQSTLRWNVVFNLARAGFNFNDGFGGGDNVTENVLFNTCRESSDHGPINSWDRQPFLTTVRTGKPSMQMEIRKVYNNLLISNYGGSKEVDTDDGSLFWHIFNNVMAFGWGQKFKCGNIQSWGNLKAFLDLGAKFSGGGCLTVEPSVFFPNLWHNDTIIALSLSKGHFAYRDCWGTSAGVDWDKTNVQNNTIYVPKGAEAIVNCKSAVPLPKFQEKGNEPGSRQINRIPSSDEIVAQATSILGTFSPSV
eukprot:m.41893 g.41893  ORF g.41893 m.41893 type:complete len:814 (+) comp16925_c0_seq2:2-2443(+)